MRGLLPWSGRTIARGWRADREVEVQGATFEAPKVVSRYSDRIARRRRLTSNRGVDGSVCGRGEFDGLGTRGVMKWRVLLEVQVLVRSVSRQPAESEIQYIPYVDCVVREKLIDWLLRLKASYSVNHRMVPNL